MQKHHSISYMKENLPLYEQKGYVRGEMPDTNVSLEEEEEEEGNDGDEIEKTEVSPFAGAALGSAARYDHYGPHCTIETKIVINCLKGTNSNFRDWRFITFRYQDEEVSYGMSFKSIWSTKVNFK